MDMTVSVGQGFIEPCLTQGSPIPDPIVAAAAPGHFCIRTGDDVSQNMRTRHVVERKTIEQDLRRKGGQR